MKKEKWEIKKLGEVCDFINGFAFKSDFFKSSGYPIIRISNIKDEKIDLSDVVFFEKEDYKVNLNKYKVLKGDILIAMSGATTGKIGLCLNDTEMYLNQRVGALRAKNFILNQYVFYYLKTKVEDTLRIALGVAQPNIGSEQIKSYEIPIPPLSVQEAIVNELDTLHRLKELQEQQLAEYDTLAQATFYSMFGDPIENEKGWEVKKMGEVISFINGYAFKSELYKNSGFPIIRISNIQNEKIDLTDVVYFNKHDYNSNLNRFKVLKNDILIAMSGATTGKVGIFKDDNEVYLNQRVGGLRAKKEVNNNYVFYFLKTKVEETLRLASGVAQPNIGSEQIKNYEIPIPPLSHQTQFAERIEKIEAQKELVKQSITETQTLIDYTMDKYFG